MIALEATADVARTRKRPIARATRTKADEKVKVGLYLSLDAARRLGVTATMDARDKSDIVDELIRQNLRKYVVQVRSTRPEESAGVPEEVSAP